jgi:signal transduction histidine kinase
VSWPRSLRARTTLLATTLVALLLGIAGWALVAVLEGSLQNAKDDLSRARAIELATQVRDGTLAPRVVDVGDDGVAQVVDAQGRVLAASSGLQGAGPVVTVARTSGTLRLVQLHGVQDDADTEDYRAWAVRTDGPDGPVAVVVGDSLESVDEATAALRRGLLVGVPVLVALMAGGTWWVVSRSLRPVERIRAEVAALSAADLHRRVPVPPTRDELARLATTMNEMLGRLEQGSLRQQEFVADASHELQSPLASLRTQLEVVRAHPDEDWSTAADDLLADTVRMERLVRDLLALACDDAGRPAADHGLVDLDVLLTEEVRRARATSSVPIEASEVAAAPVRGDPDELARLLRNLLDNAVAHATSAVQVTLRCEGDERDGWAVVEVTDDGPGVPADQAERVFERFARVEGDRTRAEHAVSGTGLGLAIARGTAVRHGGTLELSLHPGPGATFVLRLPPAQAVTQASAQASEAGAQQ